MSSRRTVMLESIRHARINQQKSPRGQSSGGAHACLQCRASYRDCDGLIMHRIRHIEGKHWPCPVSSLRRYSRHLRASSSLYNAMRYRFINIEFSPQGFIIKRMLGYRDSFNVKKQWRFNIDTIPRYCSPPQAFSSSPSSCPSFFS